MAFGDPAERGPFPTRELWASGAAFAMVLLVGITLVATLKFDDAQASARVIAASLVLIGSLCTGVITLLGLLLRHSAEQRQFAVKREKEERLRIDTMVNAFRLLGGDTASGEGAGVIYALLALSRYDLALGLLRELWQLGRIGSSSAVCVIDECLKTDSAEIQELAASTLFDFSRLLPQKMSEGEEAKYTLVWPIHFRLRWDPTRAWRARRLLLDALVDTYLSVGECKRWDKRALATFLATLREVMLKDEETELRTDAAHAVLKLLAYSENDESGLRLNGQPMTVGDLKEEVQKRLDTPSDFVKTRLDAMQRMIEDGCEKTLSRWPKPL